ncbi:hypothetical protein JCM8097_004496 [Rhodosporidiobolus ruineniae]
MTSSSPSSSRIPSLSLRRLKGLAQALVAISVTAALLVYLAGSSPTGFNNSATAPAANAAADAFLRLQPHPPAPAPLPVADVRDLEGDARVVEEGRGRERTATDLLDPLPRPDKLSKQNAWVLAKPANELPPCDKILLFTFMPWWGFASEYILYLRAAAAAKRLGYTLVEDDRNWNYGRLTDYFLPRKLTCVPPADWADPKKAYPFHQGSHWRGRPRLRYSRVVLSNLDDWTRHEYLSSSSSRASLEELARSDREHAEKQDRWILEEGGTLPEVFEDVFADQAKVVGEMWRLKRTMKEQVEEIKRRTGLDRPRWIAGEEGTEGEKRGPVVALHVRLGDKASEYEHDSKEMGITNSFGNLTVYIEAAHDAYRRLIPSQYPSLSPSSSSSSSELRFTPYARPTLLLITAEPLILPKLADIPLAGPFRVLETPPPDVWDEGVDAGTRERLEESRRVEEEAERAGAGPKAYVAGVGGGGGGSVEGAGGKMVKLVRAGDGGGGKKKLARRAASGAETGASLTAGYLQSAFNALPLIERVTHTQAFVRDLTVIAREADAAVVSGASNVGRLAMLIAGKDAVTGPRDSSGLSLGGRIRSLDSHFYPTAYSTAVYSKVDDIEDTDHAAFVPSEQHAQEVKAQEERNRARKGKKGNGGRRAG